MVTAGVMIKQLASSTEDIITPPPPVVDLPIATSDAKPTTLTTHPNDSASAVQDHDSKENLFSCTTELGSASHYQGIHADEIPAHSGSQPALGPSASTESLHDSIHSMQARNESTIDEATPDEGSIVGADMDQVELPMTPHEYIAACFRNEYRVYWSKIKTEELYNVVFIEGQGTDEHLVHGMIRLYALMSLSTTLPPPSAYIAHVESLIHFLEQTKGEGELEKLLDDLQSIPSWKHIPDAEQYKHVMYLCWTTLGFSMGVKAQGASLQKKVHSIFPPLKPRERPKKFSVTLEDILSSGLKVTHTSCFNEHFECNGVEVKIFRGGLEELRYLQHYNLNRIAMAVKIENLGAEVFASLFSLYGAKDGQRRQLASFHALIDDDGRSAWSLLQKPLLSLYEETMSVVAPNVLASRLLRLQNLIRQRNSTISTFIRDFNKYRREQAFLFWGAVLAVFVAVCTMIQTVASVWSLVIAINAS